MTARRDSWGVKMPGRHRGGCRWWVEQLHLPTAQPWPSGRSSASIPEELQHARQALLVVDVLDGGMPTGWIGARRLQRTGNVDQLRAMASPRSVFFGIGLSGE